MFPNFESARVGECTSRQWSLVRVSVCEETGDLEERSVSSGDDLFGDRMADSLVIVILYVLYVRLHLCVQCVCLYMESIYSQQQCRDRYLLIASSIFSSILV